MSDLPPNAPWWAHFLVDEARDVWRWWSVRWPLAWGALVEIYAVYGDQIKEHVPERWIPHIVAAAFWITIVLRVVNQSRKGGQQ